MICKENIACKILRNAAFHSVTQTKFPKYITCSESVWLYQEQVAGNKFSVHWTAKFAIWRRFKLKRDHTKEYVTRKKPLKVRVTSVGLWPFRQNVLVFKTLHKRFDNFMIHCFSGGFTLVGQRFVVGSNAALAGRRVRTLKMMKNLLQIFSHNTIKVST